jgi:hypothetical protein
MLLFALSIDFDYFKTWHNFNVSLG